MKNWLTFFFITILGPSFGEEVDVTPAEAIKLLEGENAPIIIDVRTEAEFQKGHLKGATLCTLGPDLAAKIAKLDREKSYLVHCHSGFRSAKALKVFKKLEFQKIYHLKAGMKGWEQANYEVVK